jgi:DNA-binding NtrC family response regulator
MKQSDMRILVIDDEQDVRKSLVLFLASCGFSKVDTAKGAEEGLEKAEAKQYDLIILDMIMPKQSGWNVLEKIHFKKIKARVLVLSAVGLPNVVKEDMRVRYPRVEFLPKTEATTELVNMINKMLSTPAGRI